jgi:hypothetical protein
MRACYARASVSDCILHARTCRWVSRKHRKEEVVNGRYHARARTSVVVAVQYTDLCANQSRDFKGGLVMMAIHERARDLILRRISRANAPRQSDIMTEGDQTKSLNAIRQRLLHLVRSVERDFSSSHYSPKIAFYRFTIVSPLDFALVCTPITLSHFYAMRLTRLGVSRRLTLADLS